MSVELSTDPVSDRGDPDGTVCSVKELSSIEHKSKSEF